MENEIDKDLRLTALCRSLGDLWIEDFIADVEEEWPENKLRLCNLTLLGKIYLIPSIHFEAFLSTIQKAWKIEEFICDQQE